MSSSAPCAEHGGVDVRENHQSGFADLFGESGSEVAGAAGDVERALAGTQSRERQRELLPEAMRAAGHEIVHQVVAARDLLEDLVDHALLVGEIDGPIAEMRFAGVRHCKPSVTARP